MLEAIAMANRTHSYRQGPEMYSKLGSGALGIYLTMEAKQSLLKPDVWLGTKPQTKTDTSVVSCQLFVIDTV